MPHTSRSVLVDGFNLALPRGTGVTSYARTLTCCLREMGYEVGVLYGMNISRRMPPALREVIFFDSLDGDRPSRRMVPLSARWWNERLADITGPRAVEVPITGRVESRSYASRMPAFDHIWNVPHLFNRAARYFRRTGRFMTVSVPGAPDIMHWTYPLPIRLKGARNIYTIHDLVPLQLPYTTLDDKGYHYRLIRHIARHADAICTVSEASKQGILTFFPEAGERVHNTFQSFQSSPETSAGSDEDAAREVSALFDLEADGFFLFYGSLEPKKNLGRIIEGFLASTSRRRLVIVGAMAWKSETELRFLERGIESGRIIKLEYLPRPLLVSLIRSARAVLLPSLSEGFGLPVLEALSAGTPVLTSREGSLPEVAGDAAMYVDAYDTASITGGIERLDADNALCDRIRMLAPGQVRKFSMSDYSQCLSSLYDAMMQTRM